MCCRRGQDRSYRGLFCGAWYCERRSAPGRDAIARAIEAAKARCLSCIINALVRLVGCVMGSGTILDKEVGSDTEAAVRRFLSLISNRYDTVGAIIYGSRARGTHQPDSDADLAVLLAGRHQRVLPTTLAMADVAYDVLLETDINVTPVPIWLDEWEHPERHSNPALLHNIARDGIRL